MTFVLDDYRFDAATGQAEFYYNFESTNYRFCERIKFQPVTQFNEAAFDRALFLAFVLIGTSYYKAFPSRQVKLNIGELDQFQTEFFSRVYQEGLSQFAFENQLQRSDLAQFNATTKETVKPVDYRGQGVVSLQSGGKDSLLVASLLQPQSLTGEWLYVSHGPEHPAVIERLGWPLSQVDRQVDRQGLSATTTAGGLNGHVPVTYIISAIGLLQLILSGRQYLVSAIGHEGEEAHAWIGDLAVNHQWSKTWSAEQALVDYVRRYISSDIKVGSLLRQYSELKIAELFSAHCWAEYGRDFSSCNRANYQQGSNNRHLSWCGNCPKCANSYLLFAPFVASDELTALFDGQDLFAKPSLTEIFKGLLAVDDVMKPFECVGEIAELRQAYRLALANGYQPLPFEVEASTFDYNQTYPAADWVAALVQY